jgi:hypothetical protein
VVPDGCVSVASGVSRHPCPSGRQRANPLPSHGRRAGEREGIARRAAARVGVTAALLATDTWPAPSHGPFPPKGNHPKANAMRGYGMLTVPPKHSSMYSLTC